MLPWILLLRASPFHNLFYGIRSLGSCSLLSFNGAEPKR
jgi:hypothetical protein